MGEYRSVRQERQNIKTLETLADHVATEMTPTGYWSNFPKFIISQLKSWDGEAAIGDNQYGYDWLPKKVGDHSHMPMFIAIGQD
jgi:formate dehydrogenase major subunit